MDGSFKTVIARFGFREGAPVERPRNITIVEDSPAPGVRRHRGSLYILIVTLGGLPDPGYTVQRLAEIIQTEYYEGTGSVTGSIGAALRAANDWLFEENLNSPREQRGVAGVSCAALRDGELFLGQIGPALAYLAQADGLRRFPEESAWLREAIPPDAERAAAPPLGVRRVIEPQFYHASVAEGDALVLASPSLARLAPGQAIAQALELGVQRARQQLQMYAAGEDLSVLIVGLEAEAASLPWPREEGAGPAEEPPGEEAEREPRPTRAAPSRRPVRAGPQDMGLQLQRQLGRLGRSLGTLLRSTLPDHGPPQRPARRRPAQASSRGSGGRTLAILVILVPVLVLAVATIARWQFENSRKAQVADLLRQASEAQAAAVSTGQREVQRQGLRQAIDLVDRALKVIPDEAAALNMRRKIVEELDAASGVQRLYTMWELANLAPDATSLAEPTRVIVRDRDVFVLDQTSGRVYHRVLNPAGDALEAPPPAPILQKGENQSGTVVGDLVDMIWVPLGGARQKPSLLILDRNGSLFEWDPQPRVTVLPVADAATWKKPEAGGGYSGNFYLLDTQQKRILKYEATAGGYTNPPTDYIKTALDVTNAIDMAIDGNIYLLQADGTIIKLLRGEQQAFRIADLDEPLRKPVALFVSGEDDTRGYIFVADAGLARVVQFTKQGEFVRQYKAAEGQPQLDQLRGLFVDEAGQRIYLTSGSRLYVAPLGQQAPAPTAVPAAGQ